MSRRPFSFAMGALLVAAAVLPWVLGSGNAAAWIFTGFDALVVLGLVLLMGYTGQPSLGQAAFFGIGAYGVAILTVKAHWSFWLAALVGVACSVAVAIAVGAIIFRLRGHFLALATVAFGYIVATIMAQSSLTGGAVGISGVPPLTVGGISLSGTVGAAYVIWALVALTLVIFRIVLSGPGGLALRAIRNDETAAQAVGIVPSGYKVRVFAISAAVAAVAGAFYAPYISYVSANPFGVAASVQFLLMASIGGMNNLFGAIAGAILVSALSQGLTDLAASIPGWTPNAVELIVYGGLLVGIMLLRPQGLFAVSSPLRKLPARSTTPETGTRPDRATAP